MSRTDSLSSEELDQGRPSLGIVDPAAADSHLRSVHRAEIVGEPVEDAVVAGKQRRHHKGRDLVPAGQQDNPFHGVDLRAKHQVLVEVLRHVCTTNSHVVPGLIAAAEQVAMGIVLASDVAPTPRTVDPPTSKDTPPRRITGGREPMALRVHGVAETKWVRVHGVRAEVGLERIHDERQPERRLCLLVILEMRQLAQPGFGNLELPPMAW